MIDNSNNVIRGGGVKRDEGGDEKQLINWPKVSLLRCPDGMYNSHIIPYHIIPCHTP